MKLFGDRHILRQRGFSRDWRTSGDGPILRIVIFAGDVGWLIQPERYDGAGYVALADSIELAPTATIAERGDGIGRARAIAAVGAGRDEPTTASERRRLGHGTVTPPSVGWRSAVAVSFANDAIDVWSLKPNGPRAFLQTFYPVAAIRPDASAEDLLRAIDTMMATHRPRRS